ncbi:MAG: lipoprotein-releasing system ATP-binding protein LolD [Deltaproteobacteria bacterium HGW-Deltaproteobacteria-13]|jgi:lipoprotein-releasing system ATP-binding protein|nr:MAG: lipoprotein-releasing system ATP-binding protein LolD [Deltaproteobacteria bacterium HGW-Deltaproteobacteria-13]
MIVLENLSKTFLKNGNKIEVLRGLNLKIKKGESLAILGISGAGKSTLIHIMGMLDHPTGGGLFIDGMNVFEWKEKKRASFRNSTIGFVFQFNNLLPEFNALENTMMPALIGGIPRKQAGEKACKLLTEVGLEHRLKHKPGELSGGEQQRVAIARALIMEPGILLVDEPTGNLDTETGKKIEDILVNLNAAKGITLVTVTHNKLLAERMSDRIVLRDGKTYEYK